MWRVLKRFIDPGLADDIIGDLLEERERRARTSRPAAAVWYWRQSLAILAYIGLRSCRVSLAGLLQSVRSAGRQHHFRQAFRSVRHTPWYSATITGVMALSLALAATVFAVVDGVLFKPLPYPDAGELWVVNASTHGVVSRVPSRISLADVTAWREALPGARFTPFRINLASRLEDVNDLPFGAAEVQQSFFDTIGVRPLLGGFQPEHFTDGSNEAPIIVSYHLWQTRFAGAPDIVGTHVTKGMAALLIVGVMPRDFVFPSRTNVQVLRPFAPSDNDLTNPRGRYFEVIARLPATLSQAAAAERIELGMASVARTFPPLPPPPPGARYANVAAPFNHVSLVPLAEQLTAQSRPLFVAVAIAAGALVLLGCVNVSGLMAARGFDRVREIELRRALGAQTSDITGLIVTEAAVLVGAGAVMGLALASPLLNVALRLLPPDLALLKTPAVDWRVVAFSLLAMMVAVAGISFLPIRRGLRSGQAVVAMEGGRNATPARTAGRVFVIASQIAIGLVLTLGGTLFVGSLARLWQNDLGMQPEGVTAIELRIPPQAFDAQPDVVEVQTSRLLASVRAIPGVLHAGATDGSLFKNVAFSDIGFKTPAGAQGSPMVSLHGVSPGFFETMQLRLVGGRLPSGEELAVGRDVAVLSESVAKASFPDGNAVGQQIRFGSRPPRLFQVIGVVADARFNAWDDSKLFPIYGPMKALDRGVSPSLLIRTPTSEQGRVLAEAMRLVDAGGPSIRAVRAMTLDQMLAESVRPRRFQSWLFGSFAIAALAIVGVGILGLMAMTMARRVREIGVRIALGATHRSVVMLVVREQAAAIGAGLFVGTLLSLWLGRFLSSYLYESTPYDPLAWGATVVLVAGMALAGAVIPAFRAGRVDPVRALRSD